MPVRQSTHPHDEPVGPQQRLRELLEQLTVAAGSPSGRDISRRLSTDAHTKALSHQTACVILKCERPTTDKNLLRVVRLLLQMDRCHAQLPDGERRAREKEVWEQAHALWAAWKAEIARRSEGPLPQAFAARLRGAVLDDLGDFDVLSGRLRRLLPAEQANAMSASVLAAWADGTRTPQLHELTLLIRLLAEDGRALSAQDHQALLHAYFDLLRHHDPDRFHQHILADERDALREYAAHLENAREQALRRQYHERAQHQAALARAQTRLREAEERADRAAALAHQRGDRAAQLAYEAESLRADLAAARDATVIVQGQMVELRRERNALGRQYLELATVKEAEDTLARAAKEAATWPTSAEHLRPAASPYPHESPYPHDPSYAADSPYPYGDPSHTTPGAPPLPGPGHSAPCGTVDTPTLQLTRPIPRQALSASDAWTTWTMPPCRATAHGSGTVVWAVARAAPRLALVPSPRDTRVPGPAEAPPPRPKRPLGRLRSILQPGHGRHARPRA